ncbi:hypothetical protein HPB50_008416 [Hyalomma asiaticum]|uniref:Uncharacterized protein n=1 Tax=Hyalomma asiaticum TaxID=266040 RepID=A0ACB7RTP9_HYAAI|nr:hypothetical protein HPB50_008416 [Hyalomma asiaticum]
MPQPQSKENSSSTGASPSQQRASSNAPNKPAAEAESESTTAESPSPSPVREIVLVLRPPPPADQTQAQDQAGSQGGDREGDQTPEDEKFCVQLWMLWAAMTCPLVLCLWLFLVPYMVNNNATMLPPAMPTFRGPASVTSVMGTVSINLPPNVPPACLKPVSLPAISVPLSILPDPVPGPSRQPVRPFFCLYNNTAVLLSRNYSDVRVSYDYTLEVLPFDLCHYVIYWSVTIANGNVTSRLPVFDQQHGLYHLRNVTDSLGFSSVKILLALGGYPEDGPHFSILGHDPVTLNRLTANVIYAMRSFRLDGVAVHWVDPGSTCRGPDDHGIVAALLRMLRQAFDSNALSHVIVTAMLDGREPVERLLSTSKDVVDYFFLTDPRLLANMSRSFYDICATFSDNIVGTINHYISSVPGLRQTQICVAEPVAFFAFDGDIDVTTKQFSPQQGLGYRRAPIYESCNRMRFCRQVTSSHSCISHFAKYGNRPNSTTLQEATAYFTELGYTLEARLRARSPSSTGGEPCTFATLIEYDNYAGQCGIGYNRHLLLRHLYFGSLGQRLSNGSIEDAARPYRSSTC